MYERKSRRCCAAMLTVSVCLRLCMALGLDAAAVAGLARAAESREFARWMLFLETGAAVQAEQEEEPPRLWVLKMTPAERQEPELPPPSVEEEPYVPQLAGAEDVQIAGGCTYTVDKHALLNRRSALNVSGDKPKILIVHTHGTEAYTPSGTDGYTACGSYRTLDLAQSVVRVGAVLAQTLEQHGIAVLHDTALYDYPSYNDSYASALEGVRQWIAQDPDICMVIDLHRDAVEDSSGGAVALSSSQEGENCARLMLVVGTDQGGLHHPDWQENLANALKLQAVLEGSYPGLCRNLDLRTERFNQHTSPGALLVEVGTNGNTLEQAERSARLLGNGLAEMILALESNGGYLLPQ